MYAVRNRIMQFRSRDNGETRQHVSDYQQRSPASFASRRRMDLFWRQPNHPNVAGCSGSPYLPSALRAIWSRQRSDLAPAISTAVSKGNERQIETIGGEKLILMARPDTGDHNRQFESTDGEKPDLKGDTIPPTAGVNSAWNN
jgi:hypothetical protein